MPCTRGYLVSDARTPMRVTAVLLAAGGGTRFQADDATADGQQRGLRQHLAADPRYAGADGMTRGEFAPAAGRSHEEQIHEVDGADQEHEECAGPQEIQGRAHVTYDFLLQRDHGRPIISRCACSTDAPGPSRAIMTQLLLWRDASDC